jgi:hypothetical protein
MINLIARLRARPDDRCVWGLTSHMALCLLSQDDCISPRYVVVEPLDQRCYFVEYLMPRTSVPWRGGLRARRSAKRGRSRPDGRHCDGPLGRLSA